MLLGRCRCAGPAMPKGLGQRPRQAEVEQLERGEVARQPVAVSRDRPGEGQILGLDVPMQHLAASRELAAKSCLATSAASGPAVGRSDGWANSEAPRQGRARVTASTSKSRASSSSVLSAHRGAPVGRASVLAPPPKSVVPPRSPCETCARSRFRAGPSVAPEHALSQCAALRRHGLNDADGLVLPATESGYGNL